LAVVFLSEQNTCEKEHVVHAFKLKRRRKMQAGAGPNSTGLTNTTAAPFTNASGNTSVVQTFWCRVFFFFGKFFVLGGIFCQKNKSV